MTEPSARNFRAWLTPPNPKYVSPAALCKLDVAEVGAQPFRVLLTNSRLGCHHPWRMIDRRAPVSRRRAASISPLARFSHDFPLRRRHCVFRRRTPRRCASLVLAVLLRSAWRRRRLPAPAQHVRRFSSVARSSLRERLLSLCWRHEPRAVRSRPRSLTFDRALRDPLDEQRSFAGSAVRASATLRAGAASRPARAAFARRWTHATAPKWARAAAGRQRRACRGRAGCASTRRCAIICPFSPATTRSSRPGRTPMKVCRWRMRT